LRVGLFEGSQPFAETVGVFVGDGEDADAALRAAWAADEVVGAAAVGVGYRDVYDLDESIRHCERNWRSLVIMNHQRFPLA
jgi:hypothetical protein